MRRVRIEIEAIVPYLQNPPTEMTINQITGEGGKKITPTDLKEDWINKQIKNSKGEYIVPSRHFQGSLDRGMCSPEPIKSNKIKMTRQKAKGVIFVQNDAVMTNGGTKVEPTLNKNAISTINGLAIQYRPEYKEGFKAVFEVLIAQDWLTLKSFEEGAIQAGLCHGIGSWSPKYGRYKVNKIELIK